MRSISSMASPELCPASRCWPLSGWRESRCNAPATARATPQLERSTEDRGTMPSVALSPANGEAVGLGRGAGRQIEALQRFFVHAVRRVGLHGHAQHAAFVARNR